MMESSKRYIVKESKIFKTRKLYTTDSTLFQLVLSKITDNFICSFNEKQSYKINYSDYFTKDNIKISGNMTVDFTVTSPTKYSYEILTKSIIDVLLRTLLASYFESLTLEELLGRDYDEDDEKCVNNLNELLDKYLPAVHIDKISGFKEFVYKQYLTNDIASMTKGKKGHVDNEIFANRIVTYYAEDDIKAKKIYPKEVFIAKNEVLYYAGKISKPGKYKNGKAKGVIIADGKHVYSPAYETYIDKNGVATNVYPNFIYNVTDKYKYLHHYGEIRNLLNQLAAIIVRRAYRPNDIVVDVHSEYDLKRYNQVIKDALLSAEEFGIRIKCITYTLKEHDIKKEDVKKRDRNGVSYIDIKRK